MTVSTSPRYHYWRDSTERRVRCPKGHEWTPDMRQHSGRGDITCQFVTPGGNPREHCNALLLVLVVPRYEKRLVAEVSRADLAWLAAQSLAPETELAYLLSTPVRRAVDSNTTGA